jgi:hypothetical protein
MSRLVNAHLVKDQAHELYVITRDAAGSGGANHHYHISGFNTATNASDPFTATYGQPAVHATVLFQNGSVPEMGANGVTHEVLLAIVIDRLRSFQAGPFASRENELALTNIEQGLMWLKQRTYDRMHRGVEGRYAK